MEGLPKSQPKQPTQSTNEAITFQPIQESGLGIEKIKEISDLIVTNQNIKGIRIGFDDKGGGRKVEYSPGVLVDSTGYDTQDLTSALRIISQKLFPDLHNIRSVCSNLANELFCQVRDGMTQEEAVQKLFDIYKINNPKVISGKAIVDLAQSLKDKEIEPEQTERIKKLLFEGVNIVN